MNIKDCISIIWKRKWWILLIAAISAGTAFVSTLPAVCPPMYEARYDCKHKSLPELRDVNVFAVVEKTAADTQLRQALLGIYNRPESLLTAEDYPRMIRLSIDKAERISVVVRHPDAATADAVAHALLSAVSDSLQSQALRDFQVQIDFMLEKIKVASQTADVKKREEIIVNDHPDWPESQTLNMLIASLNNYLVMERDTLLAHSPAGMTITDSAIIADINKLKTNNVELGEYPYLQDLHKPAAVHVRQVPARVGITLYAGVVALVVASLLFVVWAAIKREKK